MFAIFRRCEFWLWSVEFLGHIIFGKSIMIYPKKAKTVRNFPISPSNILSYLCLVGYYRNLWKTSHLLRSLLKCWMEKGQILIVGGVWKELSKIKGLPNFNLYFNITKCIIWILGTQWFSRVSVHATWKGYIICL